MISYLWQVALHSGTMGLILYVWVHRVGLPAGPTRQRLLALLLVLPMVTAAIPWRTSVEFGERVAWLNSARLLAIPLPVGLEGVHLGHVLAAGGALMVLLTIWQEILPALGRRAPSDGPAPEALVASARARPGWEQCEVLVTGESAMAVATSGRPGRPRLIVSRGALEILNREELAAVLTHEHAHWQAGRWWQTHAMFAVRLLQSHNPVAMWAFREYCIEMEIGCDAAAVAGRDPRLLARVLLRVYQDTDRRDLAARAALRKRVDVLLAGGPDATLPSLTLPAISAVMLVVLPWLV
ncbi:MAG: M56 family metallopeptidase [Acidobacteriota bacterium]|nr:M56 family metallopeptidase [Acidobacteriota bacterium]